MTTTTDSAGHPEVAEISDLTEGLLSPARSIDVRRHLEGCVLCADVYDSLEEIRGMLGTLPGPPRMPADVAERIDAALAAEALLDATTPDTGALESATPEPSAEHPSSPQSEPVSAPQSASSGARVSRETSSAPAPGLADDRPAGHARASTGPGRARRMRGGRRRTVVLSAAFTAAALGLGTLLIQTLSDSDSGDSNPQASAQSDTHTFSAGTLERQVSDLLDGPAPEASTRSYGARSGSPKEESTLRNRDIPTPPPVPECIQQGIGQQTPIAAQEGTYEGKDAYLVVVPSTTDDTKVSAYVIDASCVKQTAASKPGAVPAGKVLLTDSYDRG